MTTQRGFLSRHCRERDEVRADLSRRTYLTNDHSIINSNTNGLQPKKKKNIYIYIYIVILMKFHANDNQQWIKKTEGTGQPLVEKKISYDGSI